MASQIVKGTKVEVEVEEIDGEHVVSVDGVIWFKTTNMVHAAVIYNMMADHLSEYMNYVSKS